MTVRPATAADIPRLIEIRAAVRENRLVNRSIGPSDYRPYIDAARCWVWEEDGQTHGFCAIEPDGASLWALFVRPGAEGRGIGRALLEKACTAARAVGAATLSLTTEPNSRAERLYARFGFEAAGHAGTDVRMTLTL